MLGSLRQKHCVFNSQYDSLNAFTSIHQTAIQMQKISGNLSHNSQRYTVHNATLSTNQISILV